MVAVAEKKETSGFGRRLRELRDAAELSQAQLGERAGMAYQAIARLERGDREPTWPTVLKLAEALGVPTDEFRDELTPPQKPKRKRYGS